MYFALIFNGANIHSKNYESSGKISDTINITVLLPEIQGVSYLH